MKFDFNQKKYLIIIGLVIFAGLFWGVVLETKAATTVYLDMGEMEKKEIYGGDIFMVDMKISSPDKSINVIDGTLIYDSGKLEIKEVSTGGSLFVLWPKPPVFSDDKGNLSFVGGTPDGFQGEEGKVLKIAFFAKSEGEAKIDFLDGFLVFLHDGKGTQINPWLRPLSLNILTRSPEIPVKDEWQDLLEKDKTPPEFIEAIISSDPHIFDNQYFVSFFAIDKESGVSYFEIKEGERDFIRAESPYLLQDQSLKSVIQIKAIDKAGNERITEAEIAVPTAPFYKNVLFWIAGFLIIILLVMFYIFWRNFRRKIKTQK